VFLIGDRVLYIPNHANGKRTHKDCAPGRVVAYGRNDDQVMVQYADGGPAKMTYVWHLQLLEAPK